MAVAWESLEKLVRHPVFAGLVLTAKQAAGPSRPVVLAYPVRNGKVLLIQRRFEPMVWSPPGGYIEDGEEAEDAARREAEEEAGIKLGELIGELPEYKGMRQLVFQAGEGEPHAGFEAFRTKWVSLDDLDSLNVSPPADVIRQALELKKSPEFHEDSVNELHDKLPDEIVIVPEWLSVTGGFVYAKDREPHDLDLVIRGSIESMPEGSRLKLERLFSELTDLPIHWVPESEGPTWAYAPMYDLVARKRRDSGIRDMDEPEFAALMYKAELVRDPRKIRPGKPIAHYHTGGEFYTGDEDTLWDKWVSRAVERGTPVLVQEKFDGFRLHIHRWDDRLAVFSDKGFDRTKVFPGLADALPAGEYILDTEFMELQEPGGKPKERWEMAWMGSANEPPKPFPPVRIAVHDLPWLNGKNLALEPYSERLKALRELIPKPIKKGNYEIIVAETKKVNSRESLDQALKWASSQPGSEGAMLKYADFRYDPKTIAEVAKYKKAVEIDAMVIGWRKVPKGKPAGEHWTREEAFRNLRKQLAESNTYIFRVAIKDGNKLIPLESDGKLTAKDLKLDWDEKRQTWTGTDDPELWHMCPGWPHRKEGEYKYANTYAIEVEPKDLKCGAIVTVAPVKFRPFKKEDGTIGYAWMFPRAKNMKPRGSPVAQLKNVLRAFGMPEPEEKADKRVLPRGPEDASLVIIGDGPGEREEITGIPFTGPSGSFLRRMIERLGGDPHEILFANVFETRDAKLTEENVKERGAEVLKWIDSLPNVKVVLALSELAARALTALDKDIKWFRRHKGEFKTPKGIPIIVSYHPAAILRSGQTKSKLYRGLREDLKRALRMAKLVKAEIKAHNPNFYPDEDKHWKFVLQLHARGRSIHGDLRCQITPDILEGWTIALQQPGVIDEPILDLEDLRRWFKKPEAWKINWRTGEILPRKVITTIQGRKREVIRPGNLRAMPKKAEIAVDWLEEEGVTERPDPGERPPVGGTKRFPGVFLIVDKGEVEYGARKPWVFEYFLHGKRLRGRYLLRAVGRSGKGKTSKARISSDVTVLKQEDILPPGKPEEGGRAPFYWVLMKPEDQTPYVLSEDAMEKDWLPPKGISALPRKIREKVPKELRYWEVSGKEALERRRTLAERFEELTKEDNRIRPPFTAFGQLYRVWDRLIPLLPKSGWDVYVEPFAGPGALIWALPPARVEVLNDKDPVIVRLYRIIKGLTKEKIDKLKRFEWTLSKVTFDRLKREVDKSEPDDLKFLHRELYLRRASRQGRAGLSFRATLEGVEMNPFEKLWRARERLRNVKITKMDALEAIEKFDSPRTFFVLDPPWPGREDKYYPVDELNIPALVNKLTKIKGKFMLIIQGSQKDLAPLRKARFHEVRLRVFQPLSSIDRNVARYAYWSVFMNYDPKREGGFKP